MTAFSLKCFSITARIAFSVILLGTEVRLTGLYLPGSSLLSLKIGTMLSSVQSTGTSPDSQDHLKITERGFAIIWARSLSILVWTPSRPIDLQGSSWSSRSCTVSLLTGSLSFLQSWSSSSGLWRSQRPSLVLMREVKKAVNVSALSVCLFVRWLNSSSHRPMLSLILLLLLTYWKALFAVLHSVGHLEP